MRSDLIYSILGETPLFLEMPHSGQVGIRNLTRVPKTLASKVRFLNKNVRTMIGTGCDVAVPEMTGYHQLLWNLNLSGLRNDLARVYTDTNRGRNDVSGLVVRGRDINSNHHGVIWARSVPNNLDLSLPEDELKSLARPKFEKAYETPLSEDEFEFLMRETYDPYHEEISRHHARLVNNHGFCIHLSLHSCPAHGITLLDGGYICGQRANRGPFDSSRNQLPDVILIHNNFAAADKVLVDTIRENFESAGLIVEDGKGPFLGDKGVTKMYGNPKGGVNVIGIEHVSFDTEPLRHLGNTYVDLRNARSLQPVYRKIMERLL